jgi:riboflavin kinase/FMN adenylyltransferase
MRLIRFDTCHSLPRLLNDSYLALGNFDGMHLGHQAVVAKAKAMARPKGAPVLVITFDPHPVRYFQPSTAPFQIMTLEQRAFRAAALGADAMIALPFDAGLARLSAQTFFEQWLIDRLRTAGIVTGANFAFGAGRSGNVGFLADASASRGIAFAAVEPVFSAGKMVSSSRIRDALRAGDCNAACTMMGQNFAITGLAKSRVNGRGTVSLIELPMSDYVRLAPGDYPANLTFEQKLAACGTASIVDRSDYVSFVSKQPLSLGAETDVTIEFVGHEMA